MAFSRKMDTQVRSKKHKTRVYPASYLGVCACTKRPMCHAKAWLKPQLILAMQPSQAPYRRVIVTASAAFFVLD